MQIKIDIVCHVHSLEQWKWPKKPAQDCDERLKALRPIVLQVNLSDAFKISTCATHLLVWSTSATNEKS